MHSLLFTFNSTHQALRGEKSLQGWGYKSRLVPTPYEVFAECGFCLELTLPEGEISTLLKDRGWNFKEAYVILRQGKKAQYELLS